MRLLGGANALITYFHTSFGGGGGKGLSFFLVEGGGIGSACVCNECEKKKYGQLIWSVCALRLSVPGNTGTTAGGCIKWKNNNKNHSSPPPPGNPACMCFSHSASRRSIPGQNPPARLS